MSTPKKALIKDLICWSALVIILLLIHPLAGLIAFGVAIFIMGIEIFLYLRYGSSPWNYRNHRKTYIREDEY